MRPITKRIRNLAVGGALALAAGAGAAGAARRRRRLDGPKSYTRRALKKGIAVAWDCTAACTVK